MSITRDIARDVADSAIETIVDAIVAARIDRRDNALWWYHYHRAMAELGPKIGRPLHRWLRRRALARVRANEALAAAAQQHAALTGCTYA